MGSYAEFWLSKVYVESTESKFYVGSTEKDYIDPDLMQLFRSSDKKIITSNKSNPPNKLSRWVEYIQEEEDVENVNVVFYSASAKIIKDRLEIIGYSLDNAKKAYSCYLKNEIESYEESVAGNNGDVFKPLDILRSMNVEVWLSTLIEIRDKGLSHKQYSRKNDDGSLIAYMLTNDWYGFPGVDLNAALRLVLEIFPEDDECVYDVTDLILYEEYFKLDEDLVEYAVNISSQDYCNNGKTIILTEGKYDSLVLSESLNLLYPHLADYFTFMDFDSAKVGGGAGNLVNIIKSFSGAGIINKVVAVFDNDTAAHAALRGLQKAEISKNIKIFTLPDIQVLDNYPTIGPSGMVSMNVNGLAGSIEPYLGKNVLRDDDGNYYPIQWKGYDSTLKKYQGEIIEKGLVQKKFEEQLKCCKNDNILIGDFDWSGVRAILEEIFNLFHEDDGNQIVSLAEKVSKY